MHHAHLIYLRRATITLRDKSDKKVTTESSEATKKGRRTQLRRIVVSEHNYFALKKLGYAGDSFNDVISRLLRIEKNYREMKKKKKNKNNDRRTVIIIVMMDILRVSLFLRLVLPRCLLSKIIICRI